MTDAAATPGPASARPSGDLPGRDPLLPPTESLSSDEFEDFTERLLNAHKYAGADVLRTVRVVRWGRRGDPQDGIDFAGELSDGSAASWQCKRYDSWSPAETREAIIKDTYGADVHHLVLSCEASTPVRREMRKHPAWRLLDKRGLQQLLEDLPHAKRRDVLDDTFGAAVRRRLMATPGQDNIVSLDSFAADRLDEDTILNDLGRFVGRQREMDELVTALEPDAAGPHVIVVAGPGGRGKSRLLLEALQQVEARYPQRAVVLLAEGVPLTAELRAELPGVTAVVVVDDAHQHPEPLRALMSYARQVPGTQVVLSCRPSGHQAVMDILTERYSLGDIRVIDVDELRLGEARTLVNSLADDLGLPWPYREQLAREATHSPHVAVIAVNLIRRGQMTRAPIVDPSLRQHVLGRFKDVTAGMVNGIDSERIGALMAIYAALHGVRDGDNRADQHIRDLTGLSRRELSRAREALRDRGVLLTRSGTTVVVPEVLGDQALEDQAAIDGDDTGFATEVWEHFGPFEGPQLIASLAWLDWRLTQRGGPSVLSGIWEDLRRRLLLGDLDDVQHDLRSLDSLASTHPAPFLGLLEELRERLTAPARTTTSSSLQDADVAPPSPLTQMRRQLFHRPPAQPFEVLQTLAPLYGRCAAHDPTLLEQALEALWALRQLPHQLGETRSERPERVVAEVLGDLGGLPDPSFPLRIVAVVERWLNEPVQPSVQLSPLFMLHSLLDKQGTVTEQSDHKTLELGGYFVSASWAAPLRQRLRALLLSQAASASPRRAAEAVHLLSRMLQPLHSSFGINISEEQERSWGEDELATIAALAEAAQATASSALRRTIRHDVSWSAEHAHLTATRHAAMILVTELDQRGEDDLAEALLPGWYGGLAHRRGLRAPTLEHVTAARQAEEADRAAQTEEQQAPRQEVRAEERHRRRRETADLVWSRAAAALQSSADTAALVAALDAAARDAAEVLSHDTQRPQLTPLYASLAEAEPARLPELVQAVADGADGPLDADLERLLEAWRQYDARAFLTWLHGLTALRPAVRQAIARGWQRFRWAETDPAYLGVFDTGVTDQDQAVRQTFLQASFQRHPHEAGRAAKLLLDKAAPAQICEGALQMASSEDAFAWSKDLAEADGQVVLELIDRAGWGDWTLQHIAAGIASNHPVLVLDHLAQREATIGHRIDPGSLPAALESRADSTAQWLITRGPDLTDSQLQHVADAVFEPGLGQGVAAALEGHIPGATPEALAAVADCLRHMSVWPAHRPQLARVMLRRARELGEPVRQQLLEHLRSGMQMYGVMFADGVSKELQAAHASCDEALAGEEDTDLRQALVDGRDRLEQQMASGLQTHDGDG